MEQGDIDLFNEEVPEIGVGPDCQQTSVRWSRPAPPPLNSNVDSLIFQQIDVDHYNGIFY